MDPKIFSEHEIIKKLQNGEEDAFELVFKKYFNGLCIYAEHFLKDSGAAQNIVEDLFCELWSNTGELLIKISLEGYLYKSVFNRCLKYLRHKKIENKYQIEKQYFQHKESVSSSSEDFKDPFISLITKELEDKISIAIENLPLQCRRIFVLSRFEDKSYSEIAEELSISVNTVKTQIGRALERLRFELKDYLIMDAILFYSFVYSSAFDKIIHAVA